MPVSGDGVMWRGGSSAGRACLNVVVDRGAGGQVFLREQKQPAQVPVLVPGAQVVLTPTVESVLRTVAHAAAVGAMVCLYGDTGRGKTVLAEQFQEVGSGGEQAVVAAHPFVGLQGGEQVQPGGGSVHHGDGDRAVERDHRVRGDLLQEPVQSEDLPPVRGLDVLGLVVDGGDGRLQLIGADLTAGQGAADQVGSLGDEPAVPLVAVLLRQWHQVAVGCGACRAAGVGEEHQCRQACGFGVVGQQAVQQPGEPDRLGGEYPRGQAVGQQESVAVGGDQ
jgi:hypothetical protein